MPLIAPGWTCRVTFQLKPQCHRYHKNRAFYADSGSALAALLCVQPEETNCTRWGVCSKSTHCQPFEMFLTLCIRCNIYPYFHEFDARKLWSYLVVFQQRRSLCLLSSPRSAANPMAVCARKGRGGSGTERNTLNHVSSGSQLGSQPTPSFTWVIYGRVAQLRWLP